MATVAGKAVTQAYYPGKLGYSYSGSSAINWPSWVPAAICRDPPAVARRPS